MSPAQALAREIVTRSDPRLGPPHLLYVFGALHRSYPLAAQRDADYLHLLGNAERLLARALRHPESREKSGRTEA